jgi:hypothetical protein
MRAAHRVPDAVQRLFGAAPQSRDPLAVKIGWTPDQQRTTPPSAARCAASGARSGGGKFCRNGIYCRGRRSVRGAKNLRFIGFFTMAWRLLILQLGKQKAAPCGICRGFCHADGSWRRIDRTGCAAVADVVETVVSAIDRFWAEFEEPVRFLRKQPGFSKFDAATPVRRHFENIAGHAERAACGARPVIDGLNQIGLGQPA